MESKNITVIGAGVLGAQIAYQAAYAGHHVTSYDINDEALQAAQKRFDKLGKNYIADLQDATEEKIKQAKEHLTLTSDLAQAVSQADLVIEAVPENIDLKKEIWPVIGKNAPDHAVLATNTSTLKPSDFADATGHPERFVTMHFANEIWIHNICEIMPNQKSDSQYLEKAAQFAKIMGFEPIILKKEQPGYVLNTLLVPLLHATAYLIANEIAEPKDIDKVWRNATGSPKGPCEIMDTVGLRTVLAVNTNQAKAGDETAAKFVKILQSKYIDQGKIGIEGGEGFFKYDDNNKIVS
ncbi:3-hydroxyacyl-CoA dehydrogenase [Brackiella oedipodis]|uniref:3-hydroxyacyl-CoA dehydrogenase n=1 Tax=Brackiella oedipodis TaxID=124225 RepID=UPI00048DED7E|nr:3-hydroxyacyl-CoA dehydrogenase [Brackiella oedipodis]